MCGEPRGGTRVGSHALIGLSTCLNGDDGDAAPHASAENAKIWGDGRQLSRWDLESGGEDKIWQLQRLVISRVLLTVYRGLANRRLSVRHPLMTFQGSNGAELHRNKGLYSSRTRSTESMLPDLCCAGYSRHLGDSDRHNDTQFPTQTKIPRIKTNYSTTINTNQSSCSSSASAAICNRFSSPGAFWGYRALKPMTERALR